MLAIIQLSLRLLAFRRLRPVAFPMARRASARNSKKSIETASDASLADLGVWYSIKVHGSLIKQERKHSRIVVTLGGHLRKGFLKALLMPLRCWEFSGTAKAPWAPVGSSQM
jgi:hypothetical protein